MSQPSLDVTAAAKALNLPVDQVLRLVERGHLTARRVSGKWSFSPAELHSWQEQRILNAGAEELTRIEARLEDQSAAALSGMSLADWLPLEAVAAPLLARTKVSAIEQMVMLAVESGRLWDPAGMVEAIRQRESLGSTALDIGVALLHPDRPRPQWLGEPTLALGITLNPVPFGDTGQMVDIFFLVASTNEAEHLWGLARLSRILLAPEVLEALRNAESPYQARQILLTADADLVEARA